MNNIGTIQLETERLVLRRFNENDYKGMYDNWKKWSGNFYYKIRKSERNKGYGTEILKLGLKEFKNLGFKEVYGQSSKGNIASAKVIENNGGILINESNGNRYYKIKIQNGENIYENIFMWWWRWSSNY